MLLTFLINSDLCSTMPHGAIPIKCTWDVLSVSIAPRDITVWPFTAFPTCFITPVFVPPVIIHAPVVLAACAKNFEERLTVKFKKLLWMQPFYAYFSLLWVGVRSHELFQNVQFVLSNVKQETINGYPFMVSCDDKRRLILSGAKERDLG